MLSVICWKWRPSQNYRSSYAPETVHILRDMVRRHYPDPHRFILVTDDAAGIDSSIEILPLWNEFADIPSPHGGKNPSCYRRLRLFHPDASQWFGDRFVSLDLDTVITGDLRPIWNRPEDFVAFGDTNPRPGSHYNGSMMMLRAGTRTRVWERFDPKTSPRTSLQAGCWGSDQGWISYVLGPGEAKWSKDDGVYSFRNQLKTTNKLPANARVISFHGSLDPWMPRVHSQWPWVAQHYRREALAVAS